MEANRSNNMNEGDAANKRMVEESDFKRAEESVNVDDDLEEDDDSDSDEGDEETCEECGELLDDCTCEDEENDKDDEDDEPLGEKSELY